MTQETKPSNTVAADKLKRIIESIEKLEAERKDLAADVKAFYEEAKGSGFDVKVLREIIRRRAWEQQERQEHDDTRDMYEQALGMWS